MPLRDTRLDILRGWLQLSIFASHAHGSVFGAYAIHAAWGLSDSSELFVLLSGFGLGSVFARKAMRAGRRAALRDLGERVLRLLGWHARVFLGLALTVVSAERLLDLPGEAAATGWAWLSSDPLRAAPAALIGLYQPEYTGILILFVWCMLLLPAFILMAQRHGAWALLPPALSYAAAQATGWSPPALGGTGIAFNPLAWGPLFLLGAWFGRRTLMQGRAIGRHPALVVAAGGVLAFGLWVRVGEAGWLPGPGLPLSLLLAKENLALPRLLHALSLAYLVAVLVPPSAAPPRGALGIGLAAAGRHSLNVFCAGLFLSYGVALALRLNPARGLEIDLIAVPAGCALLLTMAIWIEARARSRRLPGAAQPARKDASRPEGRDELAATPGPAS